MSESRIDSIIESMKQSSRRISLDAVFASPEDGVTPEQLDAMRQRATELLERADTIVAGDPRALQAAKETIAAATAPETLLAAIKPQLLAALRAQLSPDTAEFSEALDILVPPYPAAMTVEEIIAGTRDDVLGSRESLRDLARHMMRAGRDTRSTPDAWPEELLVRLTGDSTDGPTARADRFGRVIAASRYLETHDAPPQETGVLTLRIDPDTLTIEPATVNALAMVCRVARPKNLAVFKSLIKNWPHASRAGNLMGRMEEAITNRMREESRRMADEHMREESRRMTNEMMTKTLGRMADEQTLARATELFTRSASRRGRS